MAEPLRRIWSRHCRRPIFTSTTWSGTSQRPLEAETFMAERRIRSLTMRNLCLVVASALFALLAPGIGHADGEGQEIKPFECYGRWENATGSRTVGQMRAELDKLMRPMFKPTDPVTRKAIKACVIGRVKSRVGDT